MNTAQEIYERRNAESGGEYLPWDRVAPSIRAMIEDAVAQGEDFPMAVCILSDKPLTPEQYAHGAITAATSEDFRRFWDGEVTLPPMTLAVEPDRSGLLAQAVRDMENPEHVAELRRRLIAQGVKLPSEEEVTP